MNLFNPKTLKVQVSLENFKEFVKSGDIEFDANREVKLAKGRVIITPAQLEELVKQLGSTLSLDYESGSLEYVRSYTDKGQYGPCGILINFCPVEFGYHKLSNCSDVARTVDLQDEIMTDLYWYNLISEVNSLNLSLVSDLYCDEALPYIYQVDWHNLGIRGYSPTYAVVCGRDDTYDTSHYTVKEVGPDAYAISSKDGILHSHALTHFTADTLVIENGITKIEAGALSGSKIKTIYLPSTLKEVEPFAMLSQYSTGLPKLVPASKFKVSEYSFLDSKVFEKYKAVKEAYYLPFKQDKENAGLSNLFSADIYESVNEK